MRTKIALALVVLLAVFIGAAEAQTPAAPQEPQWGITSSVRLFGGFETDLASVPFVKGIDRALIHGDGSWDVGVVWGNPSGSHLRVVLTRFSVSDDSWSTDERFRLVVQDSVGVLGPKAEWFWRLGPSGWRVSPVVSAYGALGAVMGRANLITVRDGPCDPPGPWGPGVCAAELVPLPRPGAKLLGTGIVPIVGATIGAAADFGRGVNVAGVFTGYDNLGGRGRFAVQATWWPGR